MTADAKRRAVVRGTVAGQSAAAVAKKAGCTERHVRRLKADPETRFLISEALKPEHARLQKLAHQVIRVIAGALGAKKKTTIDHFTRLRAVERLQDVLEMAQGDAPPPETAKGITWEEFQVLYRSRRQRRADEKD